MIQSKDNKDLDLGHKLYNSPQFLDMDLNSMEFLWGDKVRNKVYVEKKWALPKLLIKKEFSFFFTLSPLINFVKFLSNLFHLLHSKLSTHSPFFLAVSSIWVE